MHRIDNEERRRRLAHRHGLAKPVESIAALARTLVGLHTSDPTTPFLAVRARLPGATVADLEHELFEVRSVVRMVGMRRTIFVIPVDVIELFHAACNRKNTIAQRKRLAKMLEEQSIATNGEQWIDQVGAEAVAMLEERGPTPGRDLSDLVPRFSERIEFGAGKKWGGSVSAGTRVLFILASAGEVVRARPLGSWVSGQYRWASMRQWVGRDVAELDTASAQRDLLAMWLASHGPATLTDMQWWSGWTKTETRRAMEALDVEAVELHDENGVSEGFVLPGDLDSSETVEPTAWLLPGLDPSVMGWKERSWFLGEYGGELFDVNGNAGPTVWWDGRIVGGWGQPESGDVRYELLEDVSGEGVSAIAAEAERVQTWLDGTRIMPRFPAPLDKRLARGG